MALARRSEVAHCSVITLDSPANRNALSKSLIDDLTGLLDDCAADPGVRAVVVTGAGKTFCSGADLSDPPALGGPGSYASLLEKLWEYPKPVVAAVNGHVRAGGFGLVAAADVVLCVESATFALTEVRIGVAPAVVSVLLVRRMGALAANRYMLTGEKFGPSEALAAGLVSEVVPADGLLPAIERLASVFAECEPHALEVTRTMLRDVRALGFEDGLRYTGELSQQLFASDAAAEGMAAFREKRPPRWARDEGSHGGTDQ